MREWLDTILNYKTKSILRGILQKVLIISSIFIEILQWKLRQNHFDTIIRSLSF